MRILVTRPREDSERLAEKLEAMGHDVLIEPLFTIEPDLDSPLDLSGVRALLFTSANGVRAFALRSSRRDFKVFAVGDATAAAAHAYGFAEVESAGGDVDDLAQLVRSRLRPEDGVLFHAAGSVTAGDLAGTLGAAGFDVRRAVLYRAEPISTLSETTASALREGSVDMAVFFSPRTARTFVSLAKAAGLDSACERIAVVGLSPAVIDAAGALTWRAAEVAERPTEAALIDAIARHAATSAIVPEDGASERMMTESPQEASTPKPDPAPVRAGTRGWIAPVAIALLLALASLGWTAWRAFTPQSDPAAQLAQIDQRLAALERDLPGRIASLERDMSARVAASEKARADLAQRIAGDSDRIAAAENRITTLAQSIEALTGRIDQLEQEPKQTGDPARLAMLTAENRRLGQELARLQEEVASLNAVLGERADSRRNGNLALALGQLREALSRGVPYDAALSTVRAVAADDTGLMQAVSALDENAARGIPTRADLRARFDAVAAEIVRSAQTSGASGWWRPLLDRLSSLISVRPVGEVKGDSAAAIVARAERQLAADDLAGAVAELEKLSGPAAAPAQTWLAEARARLAAEAVLSRLTAQVLRTGPSTP